MKREQEVGRERACVRACVLKVDKLARVQILLNIQMRFALNGIQFAIIDQVNKNKPKLAIKRRPHPTAHCVAHLETCLSTAKFERNAMTRRLPYQLSSYLNQKSTLYPGRNYNIGKTTIQYQATPWAKGRGRTSSYFPILYGPLSSSGFLSIFLFG